MTKVARKPKKAAASPAAPNLSRSILSVPVERIEGRESSRIQDLLAVEEPLQIRIAYERNGTRESRDLSITMRTPGHDRDLAAGFLLTEGILQSPEQILNFREPEAGTNPNREGNSVTVELRPDVSLDFDRLERHFYVSSSCGVCGKASIEAVRTRSCFALPPDSPVVEMARLLRLPDALRVAQAVFDRTGGLHAAALFDPSGKLWNVREDVGRHNAVDKLIGAEFLRGNLPLSQSILLVSGRASFELVQKALMGGIPILAAVGAPSSLAVELALRSRMTLVGFLRDAHCNVYAGASRLRRSASVD